MEAVNKLRSDMFRHHVKPRAIVFLMPEGFDTRAVDGLRGFAALHVLLGQTLLRSDLQLGSFFAARTCEDRKLFLFEVLIGLNGGGGEGPGLWSPGSQ